MREEQTTVCVQRTDRQAKKNRKRQRMTFVLLTLLFCCLICGIWKNPDAACAETTDDGASDGANSGVDTRVEKENGQFDVKLTYGIDGYANYSAPIPITVTITSTKNFSGSVGVRAVGTSDSDVVTSSAAYGYGSEYAQDVSFAAGTENVVRLTVYASDSGSVELYVRDADGDIVYEERDLLDMATSDQDIILGILSDDYSGMTYFDGKKVSLGTYQELTTTLSLDADNLPDDADTLELLDILIIDNYDTAKLNDRQYHAICTWVKNGGVLICGLGANYQNVLHIFQDDFLSGTFDDLKKQTITLSAETDETLSTGTGLEEQKETGTETTEESTDLNVVSIKNVDTLSFELTDGTGMPDAAGQTNIWYKDTGKGRIAVLGYSLSMEPIAGDSRKGVFAAALLQTVLDGFDPDTLFNGSSSGQSSYLDMSDIVPQAGRPKTSLYLLIFGIYVVVVGPLAYLILKQMKKRRYLWIVVPALALLCTGVIFLAGSRTTVRKPIARCISIQEIQGDILSEQIVAQIVCPKTKEYTVAIDDGCYSVRDYRRNSYYYATTNAATIRKTGDGTSLTLHEGDVFREQYFRMERMSENTVGHIDTAIDLYTDGLGGTVTNHTTADLSYVFVAADTYVYLIEDLKSGETYTLEKENSYDTYGDGLYYGSSLYWDIEENGTEEDKQRFEVAVYVYNNLQLTDGSGEGYVWGVTNDEPTNIVSSSEAETYGCMVMLEAFTAKSTYADIAGFYTSDIMSYASAINGSYDASDGYLNDEEVVIAYKFPSEITKLVNCSYENCVTNGSWDSAGFYDTYAKVEAYNMETGTYDEIFTDSETLEADVLSKYIKDHGMILRYSGEYYTMPEISAYGEE